MNEERSPYVNRCHRCGNGLLRLYRCRSCSGIAAICDECELLWTDVRRVGADADCAPDGSFPGCPYCGSTNSSWTRLDAETVQKEQLDGHLGGESS